MPIVYILCFVLSVHTLGQSATGASSPGQSSQTTETVPAADKPPHIDGSIQPPSILHSVAPKFTQESRMAKFNGTVQVYCWVDEHGNPSHVRVVHGVGMGLDEKAVEAVRQYKFKPAMMNGQPVKVDLYINVNFQID